MTIQSIGPDREREDEEDEPVSLCPKCKAPICLCVCGLPDVLDRCPRCHELVCLCQDAEMLPWMDDNRGDLYNGDHLRDLGDIRDVEFAS